MKKCLLFLVAFTLNQISFANDNDVVAVIGNKEITLKYFKEKLDDVKKQTINPPTPEQFLEDLIRFEVGVQEAEKQNMQNDPIVKERFRQEIYKALLEKQIGQKVQKIEVSEAEMQNWYKKNPEIRSSHILIEFKQDATAQEKETARKRALEILDEVKKSKRPFEDLAKLYSDDSLSKQNGGDVGYQSRLTLVPSYFDALSKMKTNEIKGLIETQYGFHIIKMTGYRSYKNADKRAIRASVFDEKRKLVFDNYFQNLKKNYKIKENRKLIKQ